MLYIRVRGEIDPNEEAADAVETLILAIPDPVTLESGEAIARSIYDRHKTLTHCLQLIGVSDEIAREDACKLEHDISQTSYEALVTFLKNHKL